MGAQGPCGLCWVVPDLGYYHHARIEAYARAQAHKTVVLEVSDISSYREFKCDPAAVARHYEIETLAPGVFSRDLTPAQLRAPLERRLNELRPAVVCVQGWSEMFALLPLSWCARTGTPMVVTSESQARGPRRRWWKEGIKRRLLRLAGAGLAGGERAAGYMAQLGLPPERIFTGYDIVDNAHFSAGADAARAEAAQARARCRLPEHYFLSVSRFIEVKNLPRFLAAFAAYRRAAGPGAWHLVLLGDGPLRGTLSKLAAALDLGDSLHMPGFKRFDELPLYYGLASAFVLASTSDQWGLVVNEAMAAGLPVLVSDNCGCASDLVAEGRNGFTFDPYQTPQFTARLLDLSAGQCDLAALGRCSREIIQRFSPETFARNLRAAADAALKAPRPKAGWVDRALISGLLWKASRTLERIN